MKLFATAAHLSTLCFILSACQTTRHAALPLRPPAERLQCVEAGTRPQIPPEYQIDWGAVSTVQEARSEHEAYVRSVRTREGVVAGYIVTIEGKLFACANNAAWLREFYKGLPN